jgi:hypothetical protein
VLHVKFQNFIAEIWQFWPNSWISRCLGLGILGTMTKYWKKFTISINHCICPIFHVENNLSKLQFNFAHFIGPILTPRGPAPLQVNDMYSHLDILNLISPFERNLLEMNHQKIFHYYQHKWRSETDVTY